MNTEEKGKAMDLVALRFLLEEVRSGNLCFTPMLKRHMRKLGIFSARTYRHEVESSRRLFLKKTGESRRKYLEDVASLPDYAVENRSFRRLVNRWTDFILSAPSEGEFYHRVDLFRAVLAEFHFDCDQLLGGLLGPVLFEKYRMHQLESFQEDATARWTEGSAT